MRIISYNTASQKAEKSPLRRFIDFFALLFFRFYKIVGSYGFNYLYYLTKGYVVHFEIILVVDNSKTTRGWRP